MLEWLVGIAQAAQPAAGELVPSLVGPNDLYWLIIGGVAGAIARALWTHDQKNFGWETAQDAVIGALMGGLYNLSFTIPGIGIDWPLVPLPVHATELQRGLLVAVISMVSVALVKRILMNVAPAYMAKLTGQLPGLQQNGGPSVVPPPPPTGGGIGTMRSLLILCAATALFAGCSTALPSMGGMKLADTPPPAPDVLDALANNPLFQLATQDANDTLAWVKAHDPSQGVVAAPPTLTPVQVTLASACPQAINFAIPDFQAKIRALKEALGTLDASTTVTFPNPEIVLHLTILRYGVQPDLKAQVGQLRKDIDQRLDALVTGCAHLFPAREINSLLVLAGRAGLISTGVGAPLGILGLIQ